MKTKLIIGLLALAAVGSTCWLGVVERRKRSCAHWHNMSDDTNEAKARQNELSRENGWQVELTNFTLPKQITAMTVEVCKLCGRATAVTMKYSKAESDAESATNEDALRGAFLAGVYYAACAHNAYYYGMDSNSPTCNSRPISDWYKDALQIYKQARK
jgi:hypothetical protein